MHKSYKNKINETILKAFSVSCLRSAQTSSLKENLIVGQRLIEILNNHHNKILPSIYISVKSDNAIIHCLI